jgi:hypothetical protein
MVMSVAFIIMIAALNAARLQSEFSAPSYDTSAIDAEAAARVAMTPATSADARPVSEKSQTGTPPNEYDQAVQAAESIHFPPPGPAPDPLAPAWRDLATTTGVALGIPLVVLAFGHALAWALSGFSHQDRNSN